ncbi:MAG: DUF951 domain-containing protein [Candidatus Izimaplasma sp.]|nr:DUF951 domain-containing protein [Candidatus Izimaplasma bacterium]
MQKIKLDDVLTLKKKHPCGSFEWKVIRTGADLKLKCLGCDRIVMLDRPTVLKRIKKINGEKFLR